MNHQQIIKEKRLEILNIAKNHGASNIRIFGSVARGEANSNSDIDFLMDIESGKNLLDRIALIQDLEDLLGCKVDVAKPENLHESIKAKVLQEAISL